MYVMEGHIELLHQNTTSFDVATTTTTIKAGETVFIPKGSRFKPNFPVAAKYIPLCIPAFSPDRCIREEETSEVAAKLKELHKHN